MPRIVVRLQGSIQSLRFNGQSAILPVYDWGAFDINAACPLQSAHARWGGNRGIQVEILTCPRNQNLWSSLPQAQERLLAKKAYFVG